MFEREYRDLSHVPRWAIFPTIHKQSVAEHSYYVALYCSDIADLYPFIVDKDTLVTYALKHDRSEVFMSDIPGPVKSQICDPTRKDDYECAGERNRFREESKLDVTKNQKLLVKMADYMDEIAFWSEELISGNIRATPLMRVLMDKAVKLAHEIETDYLPDFKAKVYFPFLEGRSKEKILP